MQNLDWNIYFLQIAKTVAKRSKCLSRQIGTVLVRDKSIISTGFNGPPRAVLHCDERPSRFYLCLDKKEEYKEIEKEVVLNFKNCPRKSLNYKSGEGTHLCSAGHSERNALIQAAKNGVSTLGSTLYLYCEGVSLPCKDCCIEIINAGVKEIVCLKGELYDKYGKILLEEANIKITLIDKELINATY